MIQNNKVVVFIYEYHYFCFIGQNMEMIISKNELTQGNLQDIIKNRKIKNRNFWVRIQKFLSLDVQ